MRDACNRAIIRFKLFFTRDQQKRRDLYVCLGLCSKEGRKMLAKAMCSVI